MTESADRSPEEVREQISNFPPFEIDTVALSEALSKGEPFRIFPRGFGEVRDASIKREMGYDGSVVVGGILETFDHNRKITFDKWVGSNGELGIVDKMRREDPTVAAGVLTWALAIKSAPWKVVAPDEPEPLELEQAEFIENVFENHLSGGLKKFVHHATAHVWRSLSVFEIVFEFDRELGRTVLRKLAPRLPWTFDKIVREGDGFGVWQIPKFEDGSEASSDRVYLPPSKLVWLVHDPDGDAPAGLSILRPAHSQYKLRRQFMLLAGAGYERATMGIPYVEVDPRAAQGSEAAVDLLLQELRSGARSYLALPPGYKLAFAEFPLKTADLREDRLEAGREIARAMLVPHIHSDAGALGGTHIQGQMDAFETAVQSAADAIAAAVQPVIRRLVDHNWSGTKRYPKLRPGRIRVGDFSRLLAMVGEMAEKGLIEKSHPVRSFVHEMLGLPVPEEPESTGDPEPTKEDPEDADPEDEGGEDRKDNEDEATAEKMAEAARALAMSGAPIPRAMMCGCGHDHGPTAFADISGRFDRDVPTIGPRGRAIHSLEGAVRLSETRTRVETDSEEIVRAIERFRKKVAPTIAEEMVKAGDLKGAKTVSVRGIGRLASEIEDVLRRTYRAGGEAVRAEVRRIERDEELRKDLEAGEAERGESGDLGRAPVFRESSAGLRLSNALSSGFVPENFADRTRVKSPKTKAKGKSAVDNLDPEDAVSAIASTTANAVARRLEAEALSIFQGLTIGGKLPEADYNTASETLARRLSELSSAPDRSQAAKDTRSIYGLARAQEGRSIEGVEECMFSNLLESATCGPCESNDMRVFPVERYDEFATPYKDCEGGDRCNCLVIFIPKK